MAALCIRDALVSNQATSGRLEIPLAHGQPIAEQVWTAWFKRLAARNGGLRLLGFAAAGKEPDAEFASRVLRYDDQGILVERPVGRHIAQLFRVDSPCQLLLSDQEHRYVAASRITAHERFSLNSNMSLGALLIAKPSQVVSAQRRQFFRVGTAGTDLAPVIIKPVGNAVGSGPAPVPQKATLLNISGGGASVQLPPESRAMLKQYDRFLMQLELPTESIPMLVHAQAVHVRKCEDQFYQVGLMFQFMDRVEAKDCVERICHFAAWLQRTQLERRRAS